MELALERIYRLLHPRVLEASFAPKQVADEVEAYLQSIGNWHLPVSSWSWLYDHMAAAAQETGFQGSWGLYDPAMIDDMVRYLRLSFDFVLPAGRRYAQSYRFQKAEMLQALTRILEDFTLAIGGDLSKVQLVTENQMWLEAVYLTAKEQ